MASRSQDRAVQLSADLWAKIFYEQQGGVNGYPWGLRNIEPNSLFHSQAEHQRLRLVCKRFNEIYKHHGELSSGLTLCPEFPTHLLASLVFWLRRHSPFIGTFAAYCGSPCLEVALGGLLHAAPNLRAMLLYRFSAPAMDLIPHFTSLTTCELLAPNASVLEMRRIETLPSLHKLVLSSGAFTIKHLPPQLTNLILEGARLRADTSCTPPLQKLQLRDSYLKGFHPDGIAAFEQLEMLLCRSSYIGAASEAAIFECRAGGADVHVPSSLSALTRLSDLSVQAAGPCQTPEFDVCCFYGLTSLQRLWLSFDYASMYVSPGMTALSRLTELHVSTSVESEEDGDENEGWHLRLEVDWAAMPLLNRLDVCSACAKCDHRLLGLIKLKDLQWLYIHDYKPFDQSSAKVFAALMYQLARFCPHTKVMLDLVRAQDLYAQ